MSGIQFHQQEVHGQEGHAQAGRREFLSASFGLALAGFAGSDRAASAAILDREMQIPEFSITFANKGLSEALSEITLRATSRGLEQKAYMALFVQYLTYGVQSAIKVSENGAVTLNFEDPFGFLPAQSEFQALPANYFNREQQLASVLYASDYLSRFVADGEKAMVIGMQSELSNQATPGSLPFQDRIVANERVRERFMKYWESLKFLAAPGLSASVKQQEMKHKTFLESGHKMSPEVLQERVSYLQDRERFLKNITMRTERRKFFISELFKLSPPTAPGGYRSFKANFNALWSVHCKLDEATEIFSVRPAIGAHKSDKRPPMEFLSAPLTRDIPGIGSRGTLLALCIGTEISRSRMQVLQRTFNVLGMQSKLPGVRIAITEQGDASFCLSYSGGKSVIVPVSETKCTAKGRGLTPWRGALYHRNENVRMLVNNERDFSGRDILKSDKLKGIDIAGTIPEAVIIGLGHIGSKTQATASRREGVQVVSGDVSEFFGKDVVWLGHPVVGKLGWK